MKNQAVLLFLIAIIQLSQGYQIQLKKAKTCFYFLVEDVDQLRQFYLSYRNPNHKRIFLDVFDKNGKIINSTRNITQTHLYLQVKTTEVGQYSFCFQKLFQEIQEIFFEIIDEAYLVQHISGKQDIEKVIRTAKKMINHLEKVAINQKSILIDHEKRTSQLRQTGKSLVFFVLAKIAVIMIIIFGQVGLVKAIFK